MHRSMLDQLVLAAPQDLSWNAGKKLMGNVDGFLKSLQSFDKDNIPMICVDKVGTRARCHVNSRRLALSPV